MKNVRFFAVAAVCAAPALALADCYTNPNGQPNLGHVGCESCDGGWVPLGTCRRSSQSGTENSDVSFSFRKNAIWNSLLLSGLRAAPSDPAGVSEVGGEVSLGAFSTPERDGLDGIARLGVTGGYTLEKNIVFDAMMGPGAGYRIGRLEVMLLAALGGDQSDGGSAKSMKIVVGLYAGPELHAQFWLLNDAAIDVTASHLFRISLGTEAAGKEVGAENRLAGNLMVLMSRHVGFALGIAFTDYGIGNTLTGTAGLRWGSR